LQSSVVFDIETMATPTIHRAVVKQILSGDCIVVRGKPQGGPPPERTIALSNLTAPRLARKSPDVDEPFAWEAREFLRTRLVGREVIFTIEGRNPQGKEYGTIYRQVQQQMPLRQPASVEDLIESNEFENINEAIVTAGLVEVRRLTSGAALASAGEPYRRLITLEESSKAAKNGRWCEEGSQSPLAIRQIEWSIFDTRQFVDSMKHRPLSAIVEHVRDGCTYRVLLLPEEGSLKPTFYTFMFMLSGLRTPTFKQENDEQVAEEFAEEARFYAESRILQRQVNILLESVSGQSLVGSLLHPRGNIAHLLLQEGLARCVDWSMAVVSAVGGAEAMRQAERQAKEKQLRLWRNWQKPSGTNGLTAADLVGMSGLQLEQNGGTSTVIPGIGSAPPAPSVAAIQGKVIEVGMGDSLVVKRTKDGVQ
jgi:staphylococcal nuclease domain-containing protein 1